VPFYSLSAFGKAFKELGLSIRKVKKSCYFKNIHHELGQEARR